MNNIVKRNPESIDEILSVRVDSFELGSIFDTNLYEKYEIQLGGLNDDEMAVARKFERDVMDLFRTKKPRRHSGLPAYSHMINDAAVALDAAIETKTPLDFVIFLAIIGHDYIEEHPDVERLQKEWEEAAYNADIRTLISTGEKLSSKREEIKNELETRLMGYIPSGTDGLRRSNLRRDIQAGVRIIYELTRFSDQMPYPLSMGHQFRRDGNENVSNLLKKAFSKLSDRISNVGEFAPDYERLEKFQKMYEDKDTGRFLRGNFGEINPNASEMPAAIKVGTAFRSLFPLHYINETINTYGERIHNGEFGENDRKLLKLVLYARNRTIDESITLLRSAIEWYEGNNKIPKGYKEEVSNNIELNIKLDYFDGITRDGFANDWLLHDIVGRRKYTEMDISTEGRKEAYKVARELEVVFKMFNLRFSKKTNNEVTSDFDPRQHYFYTMTGVDDSMREFQNPNAYLGLAARVFAKNAVSQ